MSRELRGTGVSDVLTTLRDAAIAVLAIAPLLDARWRSRRALPIVLVLLTALGAWLCADAIASAINALGSSETGAAVFLEFFVIAPAAPVGTVSIARVLAVSPAATAP
jgi:hypothetical protein